MEDEEKSYMININPRSIVKREKRINRKSQKIERNLFAFYLDFLSVKHIPDIEKGIGLRNVESFMRYIILILRIISH